MPATKVESFGRYQVVRETLTDRSHVYSVVFPADDGPQVVIACAGQAHATAIAEALQRGAIDVSLYDRADA